MHVSELFKKIIYVSFKFKTLNIKFMLVCDIYV